MKLSTLALGLSLAVGCTAETSDGGDYRDTESVSPLERKDLPKTFERVTLARMFQHDIWTLPAAETYKPGIYTTRFDRHVHYVCDALASLDPTYVSGLLRLDQDEELTHEEVETYRAVRRCIREKVTKHPVRFDVVLNAKQYADPDIYSTGGKGSDALRARLKGLEDELAPDLYFFDFYTIPFADDSKDWHKGAILDGIEWIHAHHALVGGNVWGRSVPPGTDFAALDDSSGIDRLADQVNALRGEVPLLMHIQNDPQAPGSQGLKWLDYSHGYRTDVLEREAGNESKFGYSYMFPVFFPLRIVGKDRVAYDAVQDGDMMSRIDKWIGR